MQEHTTAELGLLHGDVGELWGELNNRITRISDVEAVSYTHLDVYKRQVLKLSTGMISFTKIVCHIQKLSWGTHQQTDKCKNSRVKTEILFDRSINSKLFYSKTSFIFKLAVLNLNIACAHIDLHIFVKFKNEWVWCSFPENGIDKNKCLRKGEQNEKIKTLF